MTDIEYIKAFRDDNQRAIARFYNEYRDGFLHNIGSRYRIRNEDLLAEIYQESVIRLWNNIIRGKLTESNLTSPLAGYLYCIGRYVVLEIFRREGIRVKESLEDVEDQDSPFDIKLAIPLWAESELEKAIRQAVYAMGEPCAPLLLLFYWDKLSWESIAFQLSYKDANSAKAQKYKCIQKLKAQFL